MSTDALLAVVAAYLAIAFLNMGMGTSEAVKSQNDRPAITTECEQAP